MAEEKTKPDETEETPVEPAAEAAAEPVAVEESAPPEQAVGEADPAAGPVVAEAPTAATEPVAVPEADAEPEPVVEAAAEPEPAAEPAVAEPAAAEPPVVEAPVEVVPPGVTQPKKKRKRLPRALRHKHSKSERATGERKPIVRGPKAETELGRRQERRGVVVSDKGDKSIVVKVELIKAHPKYKKVVRRSRRLHAHDEQNSAAVGDVVRIVETRPISKTKHWRLAEIVEKAR